MQQKVRVTSHGVGCCHVESCLVTCCHVTCGKQAAVRRCAVGRPGRMRGWRCSCSTPLWEEPQHWNRSPALLHLG